MNARALGLHQRRATVRALGSIGLVLVVAAAAGCPPPPPPPAPPTLTIDFKSKPLGSGDPELTSATMHLEDISPIGDAGQSHMMSSMQTNLDVLADTSASLRFTMLAPGIYSRVSFSFANVAIAGTWHGSRFTVRLHFPSKQVDVRAPTPVELDHGQSVAWTVTADPNGWFAGDLLDSAPRNPDGSITIDDQNPNQTVLLLAMRIGASFGLQ